MYFGIVELDRIELIKLDLLELIKLDDEILDEDCLPVVVMSPESLEGEVDVTATTAMTPRVAAKTANTPIELFAFIRKEEGYLI